MKKWTLHALALSMALGTTAVYAQSSSGGPGSATKPSSGAVGSGQAADKGGTGAAAADVGTPNTKRQASTDTKGKTSKTDGPKGKGATPSSGAVGSGEAAPISGKGPGSGSGGGTGARTGMETPPNK